jgi:hypothetical protein
MTECPLLAQSGQTDSDQIRTKISSPKTREGTFYFAALYRDDAMIGFAMFGHYPRSKVAVIDHLIIQPGQRVDAAFAIFTAALFEKISIFG